MPEEQIINIEIAISNLQNIIEELNEVVTKHSQEIDFLKKQNLALIEQLEQKDIKPENQETPPPHY